MFGRRRADRTPPPLERPTDADATSIDLAWRTHTAQEAWTQKVDVKASVLLALEGGAIFATLTANADTGLLAHAPGPARVLELAGVISLLCSLVTAVAALVPRLGSSIDHRANHGKHTIYFGHLRHWNPDQLAQRLREAGRDDPFPMLARQLIEMSRRNWTKHRYIQVSLVLALAGIVLITLAAVVTSA